MPTRGEAHPHSAETCCLLGMALWQGGGDGRKDLEVFLHQLVFLFGLTYLSSEEWSPQNKQLVIKSNFSQISGEFMGWILPLLLCPRVTAESLGSHSLSPFSTPGLTLPRRQRQRWEAQTAFWQLGETQDRWLSPIHGLGEEASQAHRERREVALE